MGSARRKRNKSKIFLKSIAKLLFTLIFTSHTILRSALALPSNYGIQNKAADVDGIGFDNLAAKLEIPATIGSVQDRFAGRAGGATILHIQDPHSIFEAQLNIKQILQYLSKEQGVHLFFLEGSADKINTDWMRFFPNQSHNHKLAVRLVQDGILSGAELFLLEQEKSSNLQAYGAEKLSLYLENVDSFRSVLEKKGPSSEYLETFKRSLLSLGPYILNQKLKRFLREWLFYQDVPHKLAHHLSVLQKTAKEELKMDLTDPGLQIEWPQLFRVAQLQKLESEINPSQAQEEQKQLFQWLQKNGLSRWTQRLAGLGMVKSSERFQNRRREIEMFYERASERGFSFTDYSQLARQWAIAVLRSELKATDFFEESNRLTDLLLNQLAESEDEKTFLQLYQDYLLLKKLYSLELVYEDYMKVLENKLNLLPSQMGKRLEALCKRVPRALKGNLDLMASNVSLDLLFHESLDFYRGAKKRDQAIFDNMTAKMRELGQSKAVLITGGFHSRGLHEKLKEQNIAYAVIAPHISELTDPENYIHAMLLDEDYLAIRSQVKPQSLTTLRLSDPRNKSARHLALLTVRAALEATVHGEGFYEKLPLEQRVDRFMRTFRNPQHGIRVIAAHRRSNGSSNQVAGLLTLGNVPVVTGKGEAVALKDNGRLYPVFLSESSRARLSRFVPPKSSQSPASRRSEVRSSPRGPRYPLRVEELEPRILPSGGKIIEITSGNIDSAQGKISHANPGDLVQMIATGATLNLTLRGTLTVPAGVTVETLGDRPVIFTADNPGEKIVLGSGAQLRAGSAPLKIRAAPGMEGRVLLTTQRDSSEAVVIGVQFLNGGFVETGSGHFFKDIQVTGGSGRVEGSGNQLFGTKIANQGTGLFVEGTQHLISHTIVHAGNPASRLVETPAVIISPEASNNVFQHMTFEGNNQDFSIGIASTNPGPGNEVRDTVFSDLGKAYHLSGGDPLRLKGVVSETAKPAGPEPVIDNLSVFGVGGPLLMDPLTGDYSPSQAGLPYLVFGDRWVGAVNSIDDFLERRVKFLASRGYVPQQNNLPKELRDAQDPEAPGLVFQEALTIVPLRPEVDVNGRGVTTRPAAGTVWQKLDITYQNNHGITEPLIWREDAFDYRNPLIRPALPDPIPLAAQYLVSAGFFTPGRSGDFKVKANFEGNGYSRMVPDDSPVFGGSYRPVAAIGNAHSGGGVVEEFPINIEIYIETVGPGAIKYHQIYESTHFVAIKHSTLTSDIETAEETVIEFIPRKGHQITANSGVGPAISSFYWQGFGEGEINRRAASDSDTSIVTLKDGTTYIQPILNPPNEGEPIQFSSIMSTYQNPITSMILAKHDRDPEHFIALEGGGSLDVDLFYHLRPSFGFEGMQVGLITEVSAGNWEETRPLKTEFVRAVLAPVGETFDNIRASVLVRDSPVGHTNNNGQEQRIRFTYTFVTTLPGRNIPDLEPNVVTAALEIQDPGIVLPDLRAARSIEGLNTADGAGFVYHVRPAAPRFGGFFVTLGIPAARDQILTWNWKDPVGKEPLSKVINVKAEWEDHNNATQAESVVMQINPEDTRASITLPTRLVNDLSVKTFRLVFIKEAALSEGGLFNSKAESLIAENFYWTEPGSQSDLGDYVEVGLGPGHGVIREPGVDASLVREAPVENGVGFIYKPGANGVGGAFTEVQLPLRLAYKSGNVLKWNWVAIPGEPLAQRVRAYVEWNEGGRKVTFFKDFDVDLSEPVAEMTLPQGVPPTQVVLGLTNERLEGFPASGAIGAQDIQAIRNLQFLSTPRKAANIADSKVNALQLNNGMGFIYHTNGGPKAWVSADLAVRETSNRSLSFNFTRIANFNLPGKVTARLDWTQDGIPQRRQVDITVRFGEPVRLQLPTDISETFSIKFIYNAGAATQKAVALGFENFELVPTQAGDLRPTGEVTGTGSVFILSDPQIVSSGGTGHQVKAVEIPGGFGFEEPQRPNPNGFGGSFADVFLAGIPQINNPELAFTVQPQNGLPLPRELEVKIEWGDNKSLSWVVRITESGQTIQLPLTREVPENARIILVNPPNAPVPAAIGIKNLKVDSISPDLHGVVLQRPISPVTSARDTVRIIDDQRGIGFVRTQAVYYGGIFFDVKKNPDFNLTAPVFTFIPRAVGTLPLMKQIEVKFEKPGVAPYVERISIEAGKKVQVGIPSRFGLDFRVVLVGLGGREDALIFDELRVEDLQSLTGSASRSELRIAEAIPPAIRTLEKELALARRYFTKRHPQGPRFKTVVDTTIHAAANTVDPFLHKKAPGIYGALVNIVRAEHRITRKEPVNMQDIQMRAAKSVEELQALVAQGFLPIPEGGTIVLSPNGVLNEDGVASLFALYLLKIAGTHRDRQVVIGGQNTAIRDALFSRDNLILDSTQRSLIKQVLSLPPSQHSLAEVIRRAIQQDTSRNVASQTSAAEAGELASVLKEIMSFVDDGNDELTGKLTPVEKAEALFARTMVILDVIAGTPLDAAKLKEDLDYRTQARSTILRRLKERLPDIQIEMRHDSLVIPLALIHLQLQVWKEMLSSA